MAAMSREGQFYVYFQIFILQESVFHIISVIIIWLFCTQLIFVFVQCHGTMKHLCLRVKSQRSQRIKLASFKKIKEDVFYKQQSSLQPLPFDVDFHSAVYCVTGGQSQAETTLVVGDCCFTAGGRSLGWLVRTDRCEDLKYYKRA